MINIYEKGNTNEKYNNKCYEIPDNSKTNIMHLIITRFLTEFFHANEFPQKMYSKDYIQNGIRVLKKYLIPSLENQSCKSFIWILMVGEKANINYIESMLNIKSSFKKIILYKKDIKSYINNITKGYKVLITTRIDYDDRIYYDAVNDVRKVINLNKPIILHGYMRGFRYFEFYNKYDDVFLKNGTNGVWSVFASLIIIINKLNDTYTIYDLGDHSYARKTLLNNYKSFGINKLDYEPAIFDYGTPKFVYVKQKYSGTYVDKNIRLKVKNITLTTFNLKKFYGK